MSYTLKPSFSSLWWERKVKRCITGNDIDTISTPLIFSQILWGRKNWLQWHCQPQQQHTTFHISIEEFWSWLSHWVDCAAAPVAIDRLDFNRMKHFTNVYVLFTFFILELHNWILVVTVQYFIWSGTVLSWNNTLNNILMSASSDNVIMWKVLSWLGSDVDWSDKRRAGSRRLEQPATIYTKHNCNYQFGKKLSLLSPEASLIATQH